MWRCVLAWAKNHAGVTQPTAHWTEEERARVCQQLTGVMCHVRLLLIDSQVFAEEVEPTGAVPIELSLERYRYAALQQSNKSNAISNSNSHISGIGGFDGSNSSNCLTGNNSNQFSALSSVVGGSIGSGSETSDKRLQPRITVNMFPGSQILRNDKLHLQSVLNNW